MAGGFGKWSCIITVACSGVNQGVYQLLNPVGSFCGHRKTKTLTAEPIDNRLWGSYPHDLYLHSLSFHLFGQLLGSFMVEPAAGSSAINHHHQKVSIMSVIVAALRSATSVSGHDRYWHHSPTLFFVSNASQPIFQRASRLCRSCPRV